MAAIVDVTLHNKQMEVYASKHRFKVVVAGRRWGKSMLSKSMMMRAAKKPRARVWYIAPTFRMAKQIMWDEVLESVPKRWIKKVNHSTLTIVLKNRTEISLKGADRPDTLRGVALDFVVLDEFQDMKADVWVKVIRPTLSSTGGGAMIIGTPKAFNYLYELWKIGQRPDMQLQGQWKSWQFKTATSPFIPAEEIEAARADMDAKSFEQEYEASFNTMSGRVYYPFDRTIHTGRYEFNPELPIWVGQDFNIDPMSSVVMQPQPNGEIWIVDEIILPSSNTNEVCDALEKKFWRWQHNVTIYPDPAGGQRQHARGETDIDIFRTRGFKKVKYKRKHPPVADRINSVNSQLMSANGDIRLKVNETCRETIAAFEQTLYKPGGRDVDKAAGVEHPADALGYCIEIERPLRKRRIMGASV
ncbi:terminase [Halomonas sp. S2151]|uniref:terminase large subunit domain-containing protein n=1 Tax=Halomonas sp. S2151 TaxID=579478 RepID=UPI0005FA7E20|nr:terminase family protein [Halomonas sp. S2151]KJZ17407.1 terminase [Halomonas sp. S2151]